MAIPIKPISGLRQAAKEMNRYSEARAMLADFVKAVEPASAYNTMRAADASMEGETLSKFPSIVQACMKVHLTFVLELSMKPILLSTMMNMEALFNSEWFKDVAMKMKRVLDESASDTLVVFRMKNNGVYVAHNITMPQTATTRIVLPAIAAGVPAIQVLPVEHFASDYKALK